MSFLNSLDIGKSGEKEVLFLLESNGLQGKLSKSKYYDIEFILDGHTKYIEVKYDLMAAKTGNLAIEVFNSKSNTKSGLTATKSHIWAIVLTEPDAIYCINRKFLQKVVKRLSPAREIEKAGDQNATIKLYEKEMILPFFSLITGLEKDEFLCQMKKLSNIVP